MIPRTAILQHTPAWQRELAQAIQDPLELLQLLQLSHLLSPPQHAGALQFPLRVPREFVSRMTVGDPRDPLLKQVLPIDSEGNTTAGYESDPLQELAAMPVPGLLHKYAGRVLLTLTGACAIHCRYCFRRHFPYSEANPSSQHWDAALDYIRHHPDIHEVLLSGGDPLSLSDRRLAALVEQLDRIPHLQRLRIHTRLAVVLPARIDSALLHWIGASRLKQIVVIHTNHANEITPGVIAALGKLRSLGVHLLNQAVLLRDINDTVEAQRSLAETLMQAGVLPYYLHLLDRVSGAAHFEVSERHARALMQKLQAQLPGYLVPRLAREEPGGVSKTWIHP